MYCTLLDFTKCICPNHQVKTWSKLLKIKARKQFLSVVVTVSVSIPETLGCTEHSHNLWWRLMPVCTRVKKRPLLPSLHRDKSGTFLQSAFHETLPHVPQSFQTGCHTEIEMNHRHRHPIARGVGYHNKKSGWRKGGKKERGSLFMPWLTNDKCKCTQCGLLKCPN